MPQEGTLDLQLPYGKNCSLISFNLFAFVEEGKKKKKNVQNMLKPTKSQEKPPAQLLQY